VVQFDLNNKPIKVFPTVKSAGAAVSISEPSISAVCRGKQTTSAGFKWKYFDQCQHLLFEDQYALNIYQTEIAV